MTDIRHIAELELKLERLTSRLDALEANYRNDVKVLSTAIKNMIPGDTESYESWLKRQNHGGFVIR